MLDRDHDQEDDFSTEELSFVIFAAIRNFTLLERRWSPAMSIFTLWFSAANPDLLKKDIPKDDNFLRTIAKMRTELPDLFSERTFYIFYESLKTNAPYLFPQELR